MHHYIGHYDVLILYGDGDDSAPHYMRTYLVYFGRKMRTVIKLFHSTHVISNTHGHLI